MLNEYNQGKLTFKLYGVEEDSLKEYQVYLKANISNDIFIELLVFHTR